MQDVRVDSGSGNIFEDLGLPNPEEALAKALLSVEIEERIRELRLTDTQAAERMAVSESEFADILRGRLEAISLGRLVRCLNALGDDVEIVIRRTTGDRGQLTVAPA